MGNYLGMILVVFMVALALGLLVHVQPMKRNVLLAAVGVFLLYGWYTTGAFKEGFAQGLFFFVLLFMFPFQIGQRLGRLSGRNKVDKV